MKATALVFGALTTAIGCGPPPCTDEARSSIEVTVLDDAGHGVTDAHVTFQAPTAASPADCSSIGPQGDVYTCGFEVEGKIHVFVTADGFDPADNFATVTKTPDLCHVVTQTLTFLLTPS